MQFWPSRSLMHALRQTLAERLGVLPEEVFVGLGSSEIIDLAARVLLRAGLQGLTSEGTYAPFSIAIRASGAELVVVPQRNFAFDLRAMAKAITPKTGVIYLANPNNPTGTAFSGQEFREFLSSVPDGVLLVLDEAYIHYATSIGLGDAIEAYRERKNLLVLRTFSKVYGLAGLRIGYGLGPAELIAYCRRMQDTYSVSSVAQAAALAALDDEEHVTRSVSHNAEQADRHRISLSKLRFRVVPTWANFLYCDLRQDAAAISQRLREQGISVRPLGPWGAPTCIRISIGTVPQNEKLLEAMRGIQAPTSSQRG